MVLLVYGGAGYFFSVVCILLSRTQASTPPQAGWLRAIQACRVHKTLLFAICWLLWRTDNFPFWLGSNCTAVKNHGQIRNLRDQISREAKKSSYIPSRNGLQPQNLLFPTNFISAIVTLYEAFVYYLGSLHIYSCLSKWVLTLNSNFFMCFLLKFGKFRLYACQALYFYRKWEDSTNDFEKPVTYGVDHHWSVCG